MPGQAALTRQATQEGYLTVKRFTPMANGFAPTAWGNNVDQRGAQFEQMTSP